MVAGRFLAKSIFVLVFLGWVPAWAQSIYPGQLLTSHADSVLSVSSAEAQEALLALVQNHDENDLRTRALAYRSLANICASHSRKAEEIGFLFRSHSDFVHVHDKRQLGEAKRLIGHFYFYMKLFSEAEPYLRDAYQISLEEKDTVLQIKSVSNLAQLAASENRFTETIQRYQNAIQLSGSIHYKKGLFENWNRISYAYQKMKEPKRMLAAMRMALRYAGSHPDTLGIVHGDLGYAFMENGQYDSAEYFMLKGKAYLWNGRNRVQQFLVFKLLADLRQKQRRFPEAIVLLGKYDSLRTLVFTSQLRDEVSHAEARYKQLTVETELKESQAKTEWLNIIAGISTISALILIAIVFLLRRLIRLRKKQRSELDLAHTHLKQRENFLSQLFENSPSLILTHTLDGEILSQNLMVDKILGINSNRKHILDILQPAYKRQFEMFVADLQQRSESNGWFRATDLTDGHRIFRYQSKVVHTAGKLPYVITFALDDSEIFKARLAIELERQRLLSVVQNSPDIYAIFRHDSTIEFINRPDFFDGQDSTGNKLPQYLPEDVAARFQENMTQVLALQRTVEFEEWYNGNLYWVKLIPIFSKGKVTEILGIGTDITQKRHQENREKELNLLIEKNEKRYRSLVEASLVLICSHDLEGKLLTVNLPGANSMGYQPQELVGHFLQEFVPDEFKEEVILYLETIKKNGLFEGFLTICRKDGERRIFLCRNVLLKDEAMVLGSAQDVTEWKKAEYREREVKRELQIAKDEAEESNRLKAIFLGSLSHEVRTPLQGILGFAEVLDSPGIPEAKRSEYLGIIKRRTYDMQNIIESLLDIASVETGELRAAPVEMNLYEYAELIFSRTKQDYPSLKNVSFELENWLSPLAVTFVDPQHLNQVLVNLIRNAIKFTNEGVIKLTFEKCPVNYRILVSDTGLGIAQDKLEHIFKPFRQAHEGISRSKGGIGLGLSICKKMVELWRGEISVESRLGVGSTFSITIPVAPASEN